MPRSSNQKGKLLALLDILRRETDEEHPLTLEEIRRFLEAEGVNAERKSLYDDIALLRQRGEDIVCVRDKSVRYYLGQRTFDMPELRLLVDAVQSSRFITARKSTALVNKLETFTSRHLAQQLRRQVVVAGQVKSMNESIFYAVDTLQSAIAGDRQVRFQYFHRNRAKEKVFDRDGAFFEVSPWSMVWDDENYYLVGYSAEDKRIRHYRVDRMFRVEELPARRLGGETFARLDMEAYHRRTFGMFGGEEKTVTLLCADWMAEVIMDRFGRDVMLTPCEEGFTCDVSVAVSEPFFGWLAGFGTAVRITAPAAVAQAYAAHLRQIAETYGEENRP